MTADPIEDTNPDAGFCTSLNDPGSGELFVAVNNRVKDADIYGALIENRASAWVLNPTKTLGSIQRTYTLVVENESELPRKFSLQIANQPVGYPNLSRASWKQLPWDSAPWQFHLKWHRNTICHTLARSIFLLRLISRSNLLAS